MLSSQNYLIDIIYLIVVAAVLVVTGISRIFPNQTKTGFVKSFHDAEKVLLAG